MTAETRKEQLELLVKKFAQGRYNIFADKLGISAARVSMWRARGFIDVLIVAEKLPEVSAEWLLRNEGSLERNAPFGSTTSNQENSSDNISLQRENENLREELERLRKEKDVLFEKLMKLI